MNTENINKVIDFIDAERQMKFDMETFLGFDGMDCKTVGCIAGAAAVLSNPTKFDKSFAKSMPHEDLLDGLMERTNAVECEAMDFLDLRLDTAQDLFNPTGVLLDAVTKEEAIEALKMVRDKGFVDWEEIVPENKLLDYNGRDG